MNEDYANRLRWFRQFKEQINASANTLIVGVDIGKDKHHAFLGTPAGRTIHRRLIFENSIEGFGQLLFYIKRYLSDEQLAEVAIGVEPTSVYHKPLAEYLISAGYAVVYVTNSAIKKNRAILEICCRCASGSKSWSTG
jgi:transposase